MNTNDLLNGVIVASLAASAAFLSAMAAYLRSLATGKEVHCLRREVNGALERRVRQAEAAAFERGYAAGLIDGMKRQPPAEERPATGEQ